MSKEQLQLSIENGTPIDPKLLLTQGAPVLLSVLDVIFGKKRKVLEQEIIVLKQSVIALAQVNSFQDIEIRTTRLEIEELKSEISSLKSRD
jgi:hypothetical protein